jgi:GNAT superfamily N-acetyltransferase
MAVCIERLGPQHQRDAFDCGHGALNIFLKQQAGQLSRRGFGKTYVAVGDDGIRVLGFATLSVGQVEARSLPASLKLPRYPVPVMRLGRLGVDLTAQGQGIGLTLMAFVFRLSLEFASQAGLYALVVDAKDVAAKAFYMRLGFVSHRDKSADEGEGAEASLSLYLPLEVLAKVPRAQ